ncbi:acid-sensing system histidine kinase EvgS [Escherichia coli]|nr:acid-sensing system histidine kinase EvgS [Escherichia coli]EJF8325697.1 acid-sensing system histidine kinase EvgS [Escherichia coli]EJN8034456.1 acid-sensing system histidine kinase EvgS [Escherichia coli]
MKFLPYIFLLCCGLWSTISFADGDYIEYRGISSNNRVTLDPLRLSNKELRWLASKKNLVIAVHKSQTATLLHTDSQQRIRGINADYLNLLKRALNIKLTLREYADHQKAMDALEDGEVDIVLSHLVASPPLNDDIAATNPLIITFPALVTTLHDSMRPLTSSKPVNIARVANYPPDEVIHQSFPKATIISFTNLYQALASVSAGQNDYFIGSNIITSSMISRYFTHSLNVVKYYNSPRQYNFLLTRKDSIVLNEVLNRFVDALTNEVRYEVSQNWLDTGNLAFLNKPLELTEHEKQWIKQHPDLKVLENPYSPPYSMTDETGSVRGVMGDILNIITLQTGLNFSPITVSHNIHAGTQLNPGGWDILPAAIYSEDRENNVSFAEVFITTPYVFVMQKAPDSEQTLKKGMKVAIPYYYELHSQLKEMYPEVEWIKVDNASAAFHKVKEGELDALVATQLNSRYMIDHYYPNELYHFLIPGVQNASLSFAFPRGEPELKDIINKALNAIPPSEVLRLTEKWIKMPNVTIDTWDLYSEQFYIVTTLSVLLVGSSLLWGFYLLRSVRRRKVIQGDLENQISFRKALSDSLPNPTYVVNWQGNVISHNSAFEHYFTDDYYKNAMLPLENSESPFKDVFSNTHEVTAETKENRTIYTQVFEIDNGIEKRCINHWHTLCNLPASEHAVYICGWQDITETRDLIHALEVERNKAINATVAKSQFLATMSHEIRTPISSIMGFLELLSGSGLSKEQRVEAISLAYATGQSLLGLIGEILDVDKIESGNYQLQPQWVDIPTLVQNTCHSFAAIAASKSIALSCSSTLPERYLVKIDPQAFKQVLSNLLSNALKFTTEGAVKITTSLGHIDDNHAVIKMTIMDSGSGLSQEEQQQLFKRYSQTSAGRQQTGSGLGLMICKELIKNMQGDLSLESHPGIGTIFTITIPVEITQQVAAVEAKAEQPITLPEKLSILIADDHPTNRLLLKRQLNLLGYDVDEATDGVQALHKVSMQHYDLLITDVNMPNMDGFELTRKLREQNSSLPIWGLTANAQANEREKGLNCGMNLCLFKPLTLDVLKTHLSQLHQVAHIAPQYRHLDIEALKNNTANDLQLMQEILMTFQHETHKDLPAAFHTLEAGDNRTFHQCIHRIHGAANILNLQKLINISHQLEITPVSDDSKPEILQLLNSVKEHIAELDQEITVFCQQND